MTGKLTTDLVDLADAVLQRALIDLKAERDRKQSIAGRIAALNADFERYTQFALAVEAQGSGPRHAAWLAWHARKVTQLQSELAGAQVAGETSLDEARRAFGRKAVLDRLARVRKLSGVGKR